MTTIVCDICKKNFNTKAGLTKHKKTKCSKPEIVCNYCNDVFLTKVLLCQHLDNDCVAKKKRYCEIKELLKEFIDEGLNAMEIIKKIEDGDIEPDSKNLIVDIFAYLFEQYINQKNLQENNTQLTDINQMDTIMSNMLAQKNCKVINKDIVNNYKIKVLYMGKCDVASVVKDVYTRIINYQFGTMPSVLIYNNGKLAKIINEQK